MPDQRPRCFARLLRLPGRALEASAHIEPSRKYIRDRAPSDGAFEGVPIEQDRSRHDLQACSSCRETLACLDGQNQLPKVILGVCFTDGIEVAKEEAQTAA